MPARIRFVFIAGNDFPLERLNLFRSWGVDLSTHWRSDVASARGVLEYGGPGERTYQRTTNPLTTDYESIRLSDILSTKVFHLFETPQDVCRQVEGILCVREALGVMERPYFIWEPQPKSMTPATAEQHFQAAKLVDVFSPNMEELATLFPTQGAHPQEPREYAINQVKHVVEQGIGPDGCGCIVLRAAELGCVVASKQIEPVPLPAYHTEADRVVDPTGAGNAFLGGYAMGLLQTGDFIHAAHYGSIAASFAVEQVGVPELSIRAGEQCCNGVSVVERLGIYRMRVQDLKASHSPFASVPPGYRIHEGEGK